jgi:hypothetical protein
MIQELLDMFCFGTAIPTSKHFRGDDAFMYILSIRALEHDLFHCPLMTTLGFALLAWTAQVLSLCSFFSRFGWVFCLMKFLTGFHHLSIP